DAIEVSNGNWIKSWGGEYGLPKNLVTKKPYRGLNTLSLMLKAKTKGYESPYWLTFNQAKAAGGSVKKNEKSSTIFFFTRQKESKSKIEDEQLEPLDIKTEEEKSVVYLSNPVLMNYSVFNIEQIEGIKAPALNLPCNDNQRFENAEEFVKNSEAKIVEKGFYAFYRKSDDVIYVPQISLFDDSNNYYATLLHELTHWSGHKSRLNRFAKPVKFGDDDYAFEELIAELGSIFLCSHLNINIEKNRHPEYLKSWIATLREKLNYLWKAASAAQSAFDYLVSLQDNRQAVIA
ncbi:MAG: ArdC family protein, partial [Wolinella sp.]